MHECIRLMLFFISMINNDYLKLIDIFDASTHTWRIKLMHIINVNICQFMKVEKWNRLELH